VEDAPAPLSAYGRSKLAGEAAVRAVGGPHLVLRTSWLYGAGGRNFVDTIRTLAATRDELRVVCDQTGRPTWSASLARTLLDLLHAGARGTLHACDSGVASWFELAEAVVRGCGCSTRLVPVTAERWGAPAPRPTRSVLDLEETEAILGRPLPHWRTSLEAYLKGNP
jgi:dTDP-4-dehydrorhamnose reductase